MATDVDSTSLIEFNMIPTFISDELVPGFNSCIQSRRRLHHLRSGSPRRGRLCAVTRGLAVAALVEENDLVAGPVTTARPHAASRSHAARRGGPARGGPGSMLCARLRVKPCSVVPHCNAVVCGCSRVERVEVKWRASIGIERGTSASRPMTGSSLPLRALSVRSVV